MTEDQIRQTLYRAIRNVAPETNPATLAGSLDFRSELDIDSMDFQNIVVALHEELGIDIPDRDSSRLSTVDGAVAYLGERLRSSARGA